MRYYQPLLGMLDMCLRNKQAVYRFDNLPLTEYD